ncbi:MAG: enoyl-CoA hydratase/isomerase family protein [Myxococcales bacterium]|nr:enoyl-CoA hydratase/isomerase family protein [Myxococcales bacterium]MCB9549284.1 enoyl-CoA hydratase/isomerase family protein [Myxococcales bacterium]
MDLVKVTCTDGIAWMEIHRPKAMNALTQAVLTELEVEIASLAADLADLRVVVLTGAGEKAFVAGADIREMATMTPAEAAAFSALGHRVLGALEALPVPVIAAVNGFALGGGCELALACDLVYAAENARFGQPEVKLGLIPGFGGTQRLARRIGPMRALDLVVTGRMVGAAEARSLGLCLDVFPADELKSRVQTIAEGIAAMGPVAVRAAKATQARGLDGPLATGNALERDAFALLFATSDAREGMAAFTEKRDPVFQGR